MVGKEGNMKATQKQVKLNETTIILNDYGEINYLLFIIHYYLYGENPTLHMRYLDNIMSFAKELLQKLESMNKDSL